MDEVAMCLHPGAEECDSDDIWSADGERVMGKRSYVVCPDCPAEGWVAVA